MKSRIEEKEFDRLRDLALRLDIRLGVGKRKLILAGNEMLTKGTDRGTWAKWMAGVETRLARVVGTDAARALLPQAMPILGSDAIQEADEG